jgi:hypothetical protein
MIHDRRGAWWRVVWSVAVPLAAGCGGPPDDGTAVHDSALGITYTDAESRPAVRDDDTTGWLVRREMVTSLADVPALRRSTPWRVRREARISWGSAATWTTEPLLRLVERSNGGASGELVVYWSNRAQSLGTQRPPAGDIPATGCGDVVRDSAFTACRLEKPLRLDWGAVRDTLDAFGLWSLPGDGIARREPDGGALEDGIAVAIEVREGERYRAIRYDSPNFIGTRDASQVDSIVYYLTRIIRAAQLQ